jgi:hypothetical protein
MELMCQKNKKEEKNIRLNITTFSQLLMTSGQFVLHAEH